MNELLLLGVVNYAYILLRALQSRAVNFARYTHICVVGSLLGLCEVFYIITLAQQDRTAETVLVVTLTGISGCLSAVWITKQYRQPD